MRKYLVASFVLVAAAIVVPPPARAGEHTVVLQQDQTVHGSVYTGTGGAGL